MTIICKFCGKFHEAYLFKNVWKYFCLDIVKTEVVTNEERR